MKDLRSILRGIIKLALAPVLFQLISLAAQYLSGTTVSLGDNKIDLGVVASIIAVFAPLLLLLSALRDIGVEM